MNWTHTEPVGWNDIYHLGRMLSPVAKQMIDLNKLDLSLGRGVGKGNDRCLWMTDGRRIEIIVGQGGELIVSKTKEPDPDRPTLEGI